MNIVFIVLSSLMVSICSSEIFAAPLISTSDLAQVSIETPSTEPNKEPSSPNTPSIEKKPQKKTKEERAWLETIRELDQKYANVDNEDEKSTLLRKIFETVVAGKSAQKAFKNKTVFLERADNWTIGAVVHESNGTSKLTGSITPKTGTPLTFNVPY